MRCRSDYIRLPGFPHTDNLPSALQGSADDSSFTRPSWSAIIGEFSWDIPRDRVLDRIVAQQVELSYGLKLNLFAFINKNYKY